MAPQNDQSSPPGAPGGHFDEFDSELSVFRDLPLAESGESPARHASVSLADVKNSGIPVDSYEALAIVEALCGSIIDTGDRLGPAKLDASGVFIHSVGTVTAASDGRRDAAAAVQAVGRILSDILPDNDFMFLRDRVVSRAVTSPPQYSTLEDLQRAIAYYARPNRGELVQAVYLRWCESIARSAAGLVAPTPAPPVQPQVSPSASASVRRWSLRPRHALLVAGVVVAGAAAWAAVRYGRPAIGKLPWPAALSSAAATTAEAAPTADALRQAPITTTPSRRSVIARRAPVSSTRPAKRASIASIPLAALPADAVLVPDEHVIVQMLAEPESSPPAAPVRRSLQTFDATNSSVVPPRATYPQSLNMLPFGTPVGILAIEVVVNEGGTVEGAKAAREPGTIGEYLSVLNGLSSAKTWRFQPATLDGQPVKYRLLIPLSAK